MWKAPFRPREERITQDFNDGLVTICTVTDAARPGYQPRPEPAPKLTLRYQERRLGIQRVYLAKQDQVELERVLRVPRTGRVSAQDLAVTEDGRQYRVDLIQSVDGVYPPSEDLTLAKLEQKYDVSKLDTSGKEGGA